MMASAAGGGGDTERSASASDSQGPVRAGRLIQRIVHIAGPQRSQQAQSRWRSWGGDETLHGATCHTQKGGGGGGGS